MNQFVALKYPADLIGRAFIAGRPAVKRVIYEAVVMYAGWEMDDLAWAVELEDDSIAILKTSHGGGPMEWEEKYIQEKLTETQQSLDGIRELLRLRNGTKPNEQALVFRLRKRAEIRRQIQSRKSVQEGKADRLADLLEEAALEIEHLKRDVENLSFKSQK